jgi:ankyrin repeat protein
LWSASRPASPKQIKKLMRALITASDVPVDQQNSAGETALHLACFKGHLVAIQVLCESGASLHIKTYKYA